MEAGSSRPFVSSISVKLIRLAARLFAATPKSFIRRVCFIFMPALEGGGGYKKTKKKVEGWWEIRGKRLEEQQDLKVRRHLQSSGDQVSHNFTPTPAHRQQCPSPALQGLGLISASVGKQLGHTEEVSSAPTVPPGQSIMGHNPNSANKQTELPPSSHVSKYGKEFKNLTTLQRSDVRENPQDSAHSPVYFGLRWGFLHPQASWMGVILGF